MSDRIKAWLIASAFFGCLALVFVAIDSVAPPVVRAAPEADPIPPVKHRFERDTHLETVENRRKRLAKIAQADTDQRQLAEYCMELEKELASLRKEIVSLHDEMRTRSE